MNNITVPNRWQDMQLVYHMTELHVCTPCRVRFGCLADCKKYKTAIFLGIEFGRGPKLEPWITSDSSGGLDMHIRLHWTYSRLSLSLSLSRHEERALWPSSTLWSPWITNCSGFLVSMHFVAICMDLETRLSKFSLTHTGYEGWAWWTNLVCDLHRSWM